MGRGRFGARDRGGRLAVGADGRNGGRLAMVVVVVAVVVLLERRFVRAVGGRSLGWREWREGEWDEEERW